MKISIRVRDMEWSAQQQHHVEKFIASAVDRFTGRISEVCIHLADSNGAKGGVDKVCQITARPRGNQQPIVIQEQATAILPAVHRAGRRLRHRLGNWSRRIHQPDARRFRASVRKESS
jgi:putative sigma-54 modulation protein